jgi:hypothetical protein
MRNTGRSKPAFAVCVDNTGYEASLEAGKLYRVIPDPVAAGHGYLWVIDESGADYGYNVDRFFRQRPLMLAIRPAHAVRIES